MQVTEQDLRERYASMETEQLLELQAQGNLTESAARAAHIACIPCSTLHCSVHRLNRHADHFHPGRAALACT
jgi:hypothetical protein